MWECWIASRLLFFYSSAARPWARTGRSAGSIGSRCGGWSRKCRRWPRASSRARLTEPLQRPRSGGGRKQCCDPGSALEYFSNISSWPTVLISYSGTFMTGAGKTRRRFAGLVLSFATVGDEMELKFKKWTVNWIILKFGFVMGQDGRFNRPCDRLILCFTCERSLIIPNTKSWIAGSIVCTLN